VIERWADLPEHVRMTISTLISGVK
jgi:hypothetical protein